ncbi:hypothetical protein Dimus_028890 [Dionaea muscipula]
MRPSELWHRQVVLSSASSRTSGVLLPVRGQQQHKGRTSSKQSRRVVPVRWQCQHEESTTIIFFLVHFFLPCGLADTREKCYSLSMLPHHGFLIYTTNQDLRYMIDYFYG